MGTNTLPPSTRQFATRFYPCFLAMFASLTVEPSIGAPYLAISRWLRDFNAWPLARRRHWQSARLRHMLSYARTHVPFYAALPSIDLDASDPLSHLPIVDKALIRGNIDFFLSDESSFLPRVNKKTSGTTDHPWEYPMDRRAWAHTYASHLRFFEEAGCSYGEPALILTTPPPSLLAPNGLQARLRSLLERRDPSLAGHKLNHLDSLKRALRASAKRAVLWYGYPSTIVAMADAVLEEGLELAGPRAIVTNAEALHPPWRVRIEQAFAAPVFDQYGANDGGVLSQTCRRGRFHVAENLSIVEVLDGDRPCGIGEEGDIVVTNLHARVLPFIRYKVGDRGALGEAHCPCGYRGTNLQRVSGREGDYLIMPDGTQLSYHALGPILDETTTVRRWQIIQPSPDNIRVLLDIKGGLTSPDTTHITRLLRKYIPDDVDIQLITSEPFRLTPAGKFREVIREGDIRPTRRSSSLLDFDTSGIHILARR